MHDDRRSLLQTLGADAAVVMDLCDRWTPRALLPFFVVSGAELELSVIPTVGLLGIICALLTRSLGKYFGAYIERARYTRQNTCPANV